MSRKLTADNAPFPALFDASVHTASWLAVERDEESIVIPAILVALRPHRAFAFPIDSGARKIRGRAFGAIRRAGGDPSVVMQGATGAAPKGTADILGLMFDSTFIAIEAKRPPIIRLGKIIEDGGRPTTDQLHFLFEVWRRGGIAGVAWGPGDINRIIRAKLSDQQRPMIGSSLEAGLRGSTTSKTYPR